MFYTSLPIMIYAIFDREYNPKNLTQNKVNYYEDGMESNAIIMIFN